MEEDMISFMNGFVKGIREDASLSGFLKKIMEKGHPSLGSPRDYFFLTSLCDPMNDFVKKKLPSREESIESMKRIIRGNKLHAFAKFWYEKISGYDSSEAYLDGIHFGLPIIGKIDAKIGDSIVELKTKEIIPESIKDILERCPSDIEQLGFYTVLDPTKPIVNYLVYLSQDNPPKIKTFKVSIKDHNKIKGVLKKRCDELKNALSENDPSLLGRCRFCNESCSLKRDNMCKWSNLPRKECEIIEFIDILEDNEFSKKFEIAMKSWDGKEKSLSVFSIIAPRKHFHKNILGAEEPFEEDVNSIKNKDYIRKLAFDLKKNHDSKKITIPNSMFPEISFSEHSWFNYISSKNPKGEYLPYIAKVSTSCKESSLSFPHPYRLGELGIVCSVFNISRGLIFLYYPNIGGGKYKVFKVEYSFDGTCNKEIKKIVDILKSEDDSLIKELPKCPLFFHKDCNFCK